MLQGQRIAPDWIPVRRAADRITGSGIVFKIMLGALFPIDLVFSLTSLFVHLGPGNIELSFESACNVAVWFPWIRVVPFPLHEILFLVADTAHFHEILNFVISVFWLLRSFLLTRIDSIKLNETSRECHNHSPQPTPNTKRKRKRHKVTHAS